MPDLEMYRSPWGPLLNFLGIDEVGAHGEIFLD